MENNEDMTTGSNDIRLSEFTQAINDNFPNLTVPFTEHGDGEFYSVVLHFDKIQRLNLERIVFGGKLVISGHIVTKGSVEYNFSTGRFYRVSVSSKGVIRRTTEIQPDTIYEQTFNDLLAFISKYIYAWQDIYGKEVDSKEILQNI